MIDYKKIIELLRNGESLEEIHRRFGHCKKHLRYKLKEKLGEEYDELIYGKPIGYLNNYELRLVNKLQTSRCECNITKKAKNIIRKKYNFSYEEVAVWSKDKRIRVTIDIYIPKEEIGIELLWADTTSKKINEKYDNYKNIFTKLIFILLKESEVKKRDIQYNFSKRVINENINIKVLDISTEEIIDLDL